MNLAEETARLRAKRNAAMQAKRDAGWTLKRIAEKFGCSEATVSRATKPKGEG